MQGTSWVQLVKVLRPPGRRAGRPVLWMEQEGREVEVWLPLKWYQGSAPSQGTDLPPILLLFSHIRIIWCFLSSWFWQFWELQISEKGKIRCLQLHFRKMTCNIHFTTSKWDFSGCFPRSCSLLTLTQCIFHNVTRFKEYCFIYHVPC